MNNRRKTWLILLGIVLGVTAMLITVYPLIGNYLSERYRSLVQTAYDESVEAAEDNSLREMLDAANDYNATLSCGAAFTTEALASAEQGYYGLLSPDGSGIMGYIEIPGIRVYLPIYHGTDAEALDRGAGHPLGTSLPVGGASTHCVLSAHSGLASGPMFSDLEQLQVGDLFYLHILDRTLAYEIDQIRTVLPEDTSLLSIEKGADLCTLVTCTPFGVNTHRLLVRGTRTAYEETKIAENKAAAEAEPVRSTWRQQYIKGLLIGLGTATGIAVLYLSLFQPWKRGKHERR